MSNRMLSMNVSSKREVLYGLLGDLPSREGAVRATLKSKTERDGYLLEKWDLDLNGLEIVPACFARPASASGRLPAILYNHAHGGDYMMGKNELLDGRDGLQN